MKAAVVEEAGKLTVKEVSRPKAGEYQCLCETLYGAVCAGTDVHIIHNHPPFCNFVRLPAILGHESIGRVIEVGPKVRHFKEGDLITRVGAPATDGMHSAWGGFAEFAIAHDWQAMEQDGIDRSRWQHLTINQVLPAGISAAEGTMFITWRETLSYTSRMGIGAGSTVLVIGSGGGGLAMTNQAVNLGAKTVAMVGSSVRANECMKAGCSAFVDYKAEDAGEQVLAVCDAGYDFVLDVVGTGTTAALGQSCVADRGTLGIYGLDDAGGIMLKPNASFGTFTLYRGGYDAGEAHEQVCRLYEAGKLNASVWLDLDNPFTLDDIGQAFEAVKARSQVKPLIRISNSESQR